MLSIVLGSEDGRGGGNFLPIFCGFVFIGSKSCLDSQMRWKEREREREREKEERGKERADGREEKTIRLLDLGCRILSKVLV